jgi:hypothetical protein
MNFSSNLKDTLSTVAAILGTISGLILALPTQGVILPSWVTTIGAVGATLSITIIGLLTGKLPNGGTKPVEVVVAQNQQAAAVVAASDKKVADATVSATSIPPKP